MSLSVTHRPALFDEASKLKAFFRRDIRIMWSYRMAFFLGWGGLIIQVVMFALLGRIVAAGALPAYGGSETSYLEFVIVGIALTSFLGISLAQVVNALRNEQLMGTLESVLMTPTAMSTVLLGSVTQDVVQVPIRTGVFLVAAWGLFDLQLSAAGLIPTLLLLLSVAPVIWGVGMVSAAGVLTFRRGGAAINLGAAALTATSGAFFPVQVFPKGIADLALAWNPLTITLEASRAALLGGAGWSPLLPALSKLLPLSVLTIGMGAIAVHLAMRRERRRGTLGLY